MRRLFILIAALGLVAAACNSDGSGETTTTSDAETTTSETTDSTAAEATTTTAEEATTTTGAASGGGSSCIEGTWLFGSESFTEAMESAMTTAELDGANIEPTDGTYTVTFSSDGTFTGVRDEWGFSIETSDGNFVIKIDGEETGIWSADATTITVQVDSSNVTVSAQVEVDGETFPLPETPVDVPEAIAEASEYSCDSDTLVVTTDGITFTMNRA